MHLLGVGGVLANEVGEDTHWHVRPVILFEHVLETGGGAVGDQHDGLVALASLTGAVVLDTTRGTCTIRQKKELLTGDKLLDSTQFHRI